MRMLQAYRLPAQPPERGGPQRTDATVRRVRLPGHRSQLEEAAEVKWPCSEVTARARARRDCRALLRALPARTQSHLHAW